MTLMTCVIVAALLLSFLVVVVMAIFVQVNRRYQQYHKEGTYGSL